MRKLVYTISLLILLQLACGSLDLSFVNEVKRFEPKWMDLSEQVTFVDRNLRSTESRYAEDLKKIEGLQQEITDLSSEYFSLKSQYLQMMESRDDIQVRFDVQKEQFTGAVHAFNQWEVKLMKKKLSAAKAQRDFEEFQIQYEEIEKEVRYMQSQIIANLEEHNAISRKLVDELELHANFDIGIR